VQSLCRASIQANAEAFRLKDKAVERSFERKFA